MPTTRSGHVLFEVSSAFQKAIRRGLEDDAMHWAVELDLSGYAEYAWKRMKIIVSEDIGLGEPNLPSVIHALYSTWSTMRAKKDTKHAPERLFYVHAVMLLIRARKSRVVDHALCGYYANHERRDIPDYAFDKHTIKGRRMGRGMEHFFDEGAKLENLADVPLEQEYFDWARATLVAGKEVLSSSSASTPPVESNADDPPTLFD